MKPAVAVKKLGRPVDPELSARRNEEILEAAVKLFAEHGYAGTDMQIVADTVQVGKGTIYRYFPSKRALFLAAADQIMRKMRKTIDTLIADVEDPFQRIRLGIRTFLGFFQNRPDYVELLVQERAIFKDRKKPTYYQHLELNVTRWQALYRGLMADGRVRDMPVERITDVISDLLYGTIFTNYFSGRSKSLEAQAQDITDMVFFGVLSGSERSRQSAP
ncbi:MAG TPA: TetR/AcrR family transcriptional regulator [Gemmataceae bacterium]|nr:TetR/AcrR family transcriptional regulator [Gemmataceae bacterium]